MKTITKTKLNRALVGGVATAAAIAGLTGIAPATPAAAAVPARCTTGQLTARVSSSFGAAGTAYITIRLTNRSRTTCSLQGFPGVSMVYGSHGATAGAPADWVGSRRARVTLTPGHATTFQVAVPQGAVTGNTTPAGCGRIVSAAGFRVYPPGSRTSLFAPFSRLNACTQSGLHLMWTSAVGGSVV